MWLLALLVSLTAQAAEPLPALHADAAPTTVSGVSSGGYMAVQVHVAHSRLVKGAGVIAGGPYYCAQGSVFTAYYNCMQPGPFIALPGTAVLKAQSDTFAAAGRIDGTANLVGSRAWLFTGSQDRTVSSSVVDALAAYYAQYQVQTLVVRDKAAGHAMVTEQYGNACGETRSPYINDCDYDAAGELLQFLLGPLAAPAALESGRLARFDQKRYANGDAYAISMDDEGFLYVPKACESGHCRVHVAFHGCRQNAQAIGERFAREAGYNHWADTNRLIILYPQTIVRYLWLFNPRGCWDWWGYSGADYATRDGAQLRAIKAMLDALRQ